MKIAKKCMIRFVILAVVSVAFYVTKPGGSPFGWNDETHLPAVLATPNRGDVLTSHDAGGRHPDGGLWDAASPKTGATKDEPKSGDVVAGHGPDAVVRAVGESSVKKRRQRKLVTPDWSGPEKLGFRQFKALRREFRQEGDFRKETIESLHGAAVIASGAIMPIDSVPSDGVLTRFWLANPVVVMAGCVFCNPPTMGDLVYVETGKEPLVVDRERLYRSVVNAKLLGRLKLGPSKTKDGVEYMFSLELKEKVE